MKMRVLIVVASLALALSAFLTTSCDEAAEALKEAAGDDGVWCLDELLELAGLTREDLGDGADEVVAEVLAAQEDLLGTSYVIDCEAQEKNADMTKPDPSGPSGDAPEAKEGLDLTAPGAQDVPDRIQDVEQEQGEDNGDVMILLDATGSMSDDQAAVSANIEEILDGVRERDGRIAVAWYKDDYNCDDPWYGNNASGFVDANDGASEIDSFLASIPVSGGCDWPESMYDALWESADLNWSSQTARNIIVITDAPPLEGAATEHTEDEVKAKLAETGITLNTITVGISY